MLFSCFKFRPLNIFIIISGRCGLVYKASGSGAEGPGFESRAGHGVISLGKIYHNFPTGLPSVSYSD